MSAMWGSKLHYSITLFCVAANNSPSVREIREWIFSFFFFFSSVLHMGVTDRRVCRVSSVSEAMGKDRQTDSLDETWPVVCGLLSHSLSCLSPQGKTGRDKAKAGRASSRTYGGYTVN